jgi:hypothetical protein
MSGHPPSVSRYSWIPPETREGRIARLGTWLRGRSRPTWAVLLALGLGLAIGGVSFSASSLRPELQGVRADLRGWQAIAGALQRRVEDMTSRNSELAAQVDNLAAQLKARRPLPDLRGATREEVESLAHELGWRLTIQRRGSAEREGTVLNQAPPPETLMHLGARLTIVVAEPPTP